MFNHNHIEMFEQLWWPAKTQQTLQEIDPKLKRNLTVDKYENKRLLRSDLLNDPKWRIIIQVWSKESLLESQMFRRIWTSDDNIEIPLTTLKNCHQHQVVTEIYVALIGTFPIWITKIIKRNNKMIEIIVYCKINRICRRFRLFGRPNPYRQSFGEWFRGFSRNFFQKKCFAVWWRHYGR